MSHTEPSAKGMLVLNPALPHYTIVVRESCIKVRRSMEVRFVVTC